MILPDKSIKFALGGTLFGWTLNKDQSFEILDYFFFEMGQTFIDTADSYSQWKEGNKGGESEQIIGKWKSSRQIQRNEIFIATKIGKKKNIGNSKNSFPLAIEDCLSRLEVDFIDLLFIHQPPDYNFENLAESIALAHKSNKIKDFGLSNFSLNQIIQISNLVELMGGPHLSAIQNHYNLIERDSKVHPFDNYSKLTNLSMSTEILPWLKQKSLFSFPYHALCRGVLTDKFYRNKNIDMNSIHAQRIKKYLTQGVFNYLEKVNRIAIKYETSISSLALSWLRYEYSKCIPVVSCNSIGQLLDNSYHVDLTNNDFLELNFLQNP